MGVGNRRSIPFSAEFALSGLCNRDILTRRDWPGSGPPAGRHEPFLADLPPESPVPETPTR